MVIIKFIQHTWLDNFIGKIYNENFITFINNNNRHRYYGPAFIWRSGEKHWYFNGNFYGDSCKKYNQKQFVKDIAMQIAAANPQYISREEVPQEVIEKEKEILKAQALNEGKPEHIAEKMVAGRLEKFYKEVCLLEQPFVKDPDRTVKDVLTEQIATIGENMSIRRFVRFERGEGLEKRQDNFVDEVMSQMQG